MKTLAFAVPGDLATPTGGYAYDARIITELRALGWTVDVLDLGAEFPRPSAQARAAALAKLVSVANGRPLVIDGLAYGALAEAPSLLRNGPRLIALVHHPLALESGLKLEEANAFRESERTALAGVSRVISTSSATARLLVTDYNVPSYRVSVVKPGTDPVEAARGSGKKTAALLAVGSVVPRKGYDILLAALGRLTKMDWHLTIAGDCGRDAEAAADVYAHIVRFNLVDRVTLAGAVPAKELAALYETADVFVLPSRYEGYGMAFAEAIAYGLPVVGTTAGAIPETVPLGAGVLVPPNDVPALADALTRLIAQPMERQLLAAAARAGAANLPSWRRAGEQFAQAVETVE